MDIQTLAHKRAEEWFNSQIHNPYERFYLFHRIGDFIISQEAPEGYTLSHPDRISIGWTKEQCYSWIIEQVNKLPILPLDDITQVKTQVEGAEWRRNLEHNGIEIEFSCKPSADIRTRLKSVGFRWSSRSGVWYAKDNPRTRQTAGELATQGADVGEKLTYAEQVEAQQQRAEERQERLEERIERKEAEADSRFSRAHEMASVIPFGQPILIGHHSEQRDRNYRAKIDNHMRKGIESQDEAKELGWRLDGSRRLSAKAEDPGAISRKIDKFETELRKIKRNEQYYSKDRYSALVANYEEKIDYWKKVLSEIGGLKYSKDVIMVGSYVRYCGSWFKVIRLNAKSVTIDRWMDIEGWTYLAPYDKITGVRHPEEKAEAQGMTT